MTVDLDFDQDQYVYYSKIYVGDSKQGKRWHKIGFDTFLNVTILPSNSCLDCDPVGWLDLSDTGFVNVTNGSVACDVHQISGEC